MTKQKLKVQKAPKAYKLNTEKLKEAPQRILPYLLGAFYYDEDYKYFDVIRPYLDIPPEPKSLEEIQKEYDEKYDERIKSIKLKFEVLQNRLERNYDLKFDSIIGNFKYAKGHGRFPEPIKWCYSTDNAISPGFTSYVIKQGSKHQGYYTFGNGKYFKYYMPDKPNMIVRFFMKVCLGFWWVDENHNH